MEIMMETTSNQLNNDNLIWLDMEMSGLLPDTDRILELAVVVTDAELNVLGESPWMLGIKAHTSAAA
jgi:oligoribonuclease